LVGVGQPLVVAVEERGEHDDQGSCGRDPPTQLSGGRGLAQIAGVAATT
jgi:hypothetical protein